MIYFMTKGHTWEHDVQTIIQVFYPNTHYYTTEQPVQEGITIESILQGEKAIAVFYENGIQKEQWEMLCQKGRVQKKKKKEW